MPRNAKTVLGWTPLPPVMQGQPAPAERALVSHEPAVQAAQPLSPPQTRIYPRRAQPQGAPERSRSRSRSPLDRDPLAAPRQPEPASYREAPVTVPPPQPQQSAASRAPLGLLDPYSQQVFVYTKSGGAATATIPDLPLAEDSLMLGASRGVRLLRFTLISSVILMVAYMIYLLMYTPY